MVTGLSGSFLQFMPCQTSGRSAIYILMTEIMYCRVTLFWCCATQIIVLKLARRRLNFYVEFVTEGCLGVSH